MLDGDSSQDTIQPSAGVAPGKEAQAGDDDVDDLAMVAAAAAAEEALAHQGGIGSSAIDETEVARRAKLMSRPALLALRLAKEGTRKRREQQEREVEELPDLESDDWRQGGSSMGGGLSKGPSDKGTTVLGSGLTRSAGMKRRKLLSSKDGAGDEPVAFGLESVVFATAPHLTAPQRLSAKVRQQHLLTRPPMDGRSMSVLTEGGNMLYLRVKGGPVGEEGEDVDATLPLASRLAKLQSDVAADRLDGGKGGLLSMPMPELMKKVERRRYARLKARKELEAAQKKKKKEDEDEEEEDMKMVEDEQDKSTKRSMAPPPPQEQLWVNRYSPSAFPHLLSDEAINREVLRMVRSWDEYVFKRAVPKTLAEPPPQPAWKANWKGDNSSNYNNNNNNNNNNNYNNNNNHHQSSNQHDTPQTDAERELAATQKRDKRPKIRAILLCGPPGMGKTTLAHVVANHCGYRPFEINASDDRSAAVLREKITRVMQNQAVLGDKRPNCIILDEADGIDGKTGIKIIVDMIKAPLKSEGGGKKGGGGGGGEAGGSVPPLTRPLICICNDLYAPQLRALRDVAAVFRFRKTSSTRLLQRLKTICLAEGLPLESTALGALCEASGNDVRSCLNTLQFFKSRVPGTLASATSGDAALSSSLSRQLVQYIGAGLKDQEKDMLQVCNVIFRKPVHKASATATASVVLLPGEEEEQQENLGRGGSKSLVPSGKHRDTDLVIATCAAFSDHAQVLQAVHENFCQLRYTDPNLTKTALAAEWMAFSDLIQSRQMEGGYHLMEDLHLATAAAMHLLCRVEVRPRITLPRTDYDFRCARLSRQHILQSMMESCSLQALWARNPVAIVLDIVSPLMDILNPALRAINPDLYTFTEKAALKHLVQVMMACGISFVPSVQGGMQQGAHQQLDMVPALEHLAMFGVATDGSGAAKSEFLPVQRPRPARLLPNFVKLVATQEAKLEAMKRAERRKMEAFKAKNGGVLPPSVADSKRPGGAPGQGDAASKKPKYDPLAPKVVATAKEEDEPAHKTWFVKLGTKRSTTKAKPKANQEAEEDPTQQVQVEAMQQQEQKAKQSTIRFKYVAGYTNAVRRQVCMKDML